METFLDLFIIVAISLIVLSSLSVLLMFLVKNEKAKHIFFYITVALGIYIGYVGFRINSFTFTEQYILSILTGILAVVSLIFSIKKERFMNAQLMASVSLVVGVINAFFI